MYSKKYLDLQLNVINKVVEILIKFPSVVGVFLTGSHSRQDNTPFSDIDLCVLFEDDDLVGINDIQEEVKKIYPLLSYLFLFGSESLYLYDNGVRLDLTLIKPSSFDKWILSDLLIMHDPRNILLDKAQNDKYKVEVPDKPKWNDDEGNFLDWFFWMFRQSYCYILQAELKTYKKFDKLYSAHKSITSIIDKLIEMEIYIKQQNDYISRMDSIIASQLQGIITDLDSVKMLNSIKKLVSTYELIGPLYAQKIGVEFPYNKVLKIKNLIDEYDKVYTRSLK